MCCMNRRAIFLLAVIVIAISVVAIIAVLYMEMMKNRKKKMVRPVYKDSKNDFLFNCYVFFNRFSITRRYLNRIRQRIEMLDMSDNWTISRKTMRFAFISTSSVLGMLVLLLLLNLDLYYFLVSLVTVIVVHNQLISLLIDGIENKLLVQFEKFLGDVRHHYHEHGMIDEAVYDSINDCKYEMALHANKMYEVLSSNDPEAELEKYNEMAPNKFFKTFLANCYTVQKFGDKIINEDSMFLSNLNYLKQEINMEMLRRKKLDYLFNSLAIIALAPIFTLKPLEMWGVSNLPDTAKYFEGAYGFVVQIVMFAMVILSYKLINVLKRDYKFNSSDDDLFSKILKIPFVRDFISILKNKNYTKTIRYQNLMKTIGANERVEHFYVRRIAYMIVALIVSVFVFINVHSITRHKILYNSDQLINAENQAEVEAEKEILKMDREIILKFRRKKPVYKDIKNAVIEYGTIKDNTLAETAAKRIKDKLEKYQKEHFKWWELLISLSVAMVCYNIPYWFMVFRKKVLQMNMEDEVMQFHAIILMLMHIERITVEDILRWMEQFAVIFKDSISKCVNNFENGDIEALEQLKIDEPFLPFARIVENLQSASDKIPIERAFDQIKIERGYYQDKRKVDNETIVNKKGLMGKAIAFLPLIATIVFYLAIPFLIVSLVQLMNYSDQLTSGF